MMSAKTTRVHLISSDEDAISVTSHCTPPEPEQNSRKSLEIEYVAYNSIQYSRRRAERRCISHVPTTKYRMNYLQQNTNYILVICENEM